MSGNTGIVIVAHNSGGFLAPCLEQAVGRCRNVVVVDNASTDATCSETRSYPQVRLIANSENRGFAAAANQGIAALGCEWVLLLNPDAILQTELDPLVEECQRTGAAAAGGKLIDEAGRPQTGFMVRRFPTAAALILEVLGVNRLWRGNPVNQRYRCLDLNLERRQTVEQPAGAFLLIRRSDWEQAGGFDERFWPLWFEDVDFLIRLRQQGKHAVYVPEAVAAHFGAHSLASLARSQRIWYWYGSLLRYCAKHFGAIGFRAVSAAVVLGSIARLVAGFSSGLSLGPLGEYGKVIRLANRCLWFGPPGWWAAGNSTRADGERKPILR